MAKKKMSAVDRGNKTAMKLAALDPKAIKNGMQFALPLLAMLAKRSSNKYDDALVAFLEVMTEGDNLDRVLDLLKE